jgi:trigger factor
MQITRENTGELTATIKIVLSPSDYTENINKVLKDYQRKANVPGFRPGHVPFGMVKKLYGSAVFADEINKTLTEKLTQYIQDEKLAILGQPLPNTERTSTFDWREETEIEFYFDLGLSPEFDLKIDNTLAVDYLKIKATSEMVDKYIEDLRQRNGSFAKADAVEEKDSMFGRFDELDAEENLIEGGISNESRLLLSAIIDEDVRKSFLGKAVGDSVDFDPVKSISNLTEVSTMLGIDSKKAMHLESIFRFTISEITRVEPAEMNSEFFEKVFPGKGLDNEKSFRDAIRDDSEKAFVENSDHYLMHSVREKLLEVSAMTLPDEFLKRWLVENNEGRLSAEEVEKDYPKYAEAMKWQLIENRIIKEYDIEVADQELKDAVKDYYLPGWRGMELNSGLLERLEGMAKNFIDNNAEESHRLMDSLYDKKIAMLVKEKATLVEKEVSYEEFLTMDAAMHNKQ